MRTLLFFLALPLFAQSGDAKHGKEFYLKYICYSCHSFDGHGGTGARLVPMKLNAATFTAYIRNPRQTPPCTEKALPDKYADDIWAYVKTLPESPSAKDIPLLKESR